MSSVVNKSLPFLVAPSEATPAGTISLTSMDSALASLPMAALFVFEHPIHQPAETIRQALSRSLVPNYPIAGRLTTVGVHGLKIACTGEGVAFVAASASCTVHDARLSDPAPAIPLDDLTVTYAGQYNNKDPPLLLMQVTEFSCSGFAVGVTWNHVAADGVGMAQFLQAVGELARGLPSPSVAPARVDHALPELPPPIVTMTKSMVSNKPNDDFTTSYITVPTSFINRIKHEFRRRSEHTASPAASCTAFDVFVAAIWKCRARAMMAGAAAGQDTPTALAYTANVRKQAGARDGYYGNVFAFGLAVASLGDVANGDILDVVRLVRDAKARVPHTIADGAAFVADEMAGGRLQGLDVYDMLYVTSWWNLGLDDVDFGGGAAARVLGNMERKVVPACILCGSKDRADGAAAAMAFCVRQEHAEAFRAELRRLE